MCGKEKNKYGNDTNDDDDNDDNIIIKYMMEHNVGRAVVGITIPLICILF
jgi:hypothetical protein